MQTHDTFAASERGRVRITALKALQLKQHCQSLIKVETDAGLYGLGEAGVSGPVARAQLLNLEPFLLGQDPLDIERLYNTMVYQMHPYMADIPTISGVDIALWDLAGKILGRPVSALLRGQYRTEVPLYINTAGPTDWFDAGACRAWAEEIKAQEHDWQTIKLGFERLVGHQLPAQRYRAGQLGQMLRSSELSIIREGYEHCREALGYDIDIIVHCHNEWDLPTAIGLTEALEPIRPLWLEDLLPVTYSDSWLALKRAARTRIITGEKLELPREFLPFLQHQAVDVIHPDLVYAGGLTGCWKIAELAELFYIPIATHNIGTLVQTMATAHFAASVRNFVATETRISQGALIEEMGTEPPQVIGGKLQVPTGPGLGIELQPDVLRANLRDGEPFWD
jgi:L-alanine-DL-glutamate epimerase-like enolase superfamily enzyme